MLAINMVTLGSRFTSPGVFQMAYILAINAAIISDTGGPCSAADCTVAIGNPGCIFFDPGYEACKVGMQPDKLLMNGPFAIHKGPAA